MPHPWALVDNSFPTFTGDERPSEQIGQIVEYMMLLTEALKYQLENLSVSNWNTTELKNFQSDTTQNVELQNAILNGNMEALADELMAINNRLTALGILTQTQGQELQRISQSITTATKALEALAKGMAVDDEGNVTIGSAGKNVYLTGNVYINGALQGEETT